ncbi:MarR family transcriptional regulator [Bradyrhizobium sp. dw_78]|uniref:MarR family winged helix-turn-helix transcriptional regulator n=1 Tax=Bradyrhizobium sp. dw_78 TaxID=2719793 RepID=UPI001BD3620D|nr:MarR family transcriptional regulator [Bradyrhizobium sp. dw_78]
MFFLEDLPDARMLKGFADRFPEMEIDATAACLRLLRVASHLIRDLEAHFSHHGLSQARFLVLVVLERSAEKHLMPVEIARQLGISKKNTARVLNFMEEDKLIRRTSHDTDGRASVVTMTSKGRSLLAEALPGYYRALNAALRPLSAKEKKTFIELLDLIGPDEAAQRKARRAVSS